jgi:hypothetical protein
MNIKLDPTIDKSARIFTDGSAVLNPLPHFRASDCLAEVFAYQFGWTARYPGAYNKFGAHSFNYISGTNSLGLAVEIEVETFK